MEKHLENCEDCIRERRVNRRCALCRTEINYGEECGGKWCSEYCRYSSSYLKRDLAGNLIMKSKELWEAFYRDWNQDWDIKSEDIPVCPYFIREDLIIHRKDQRSSEDYLSLMSKLRQATQRKPSLPPQRRWSKRKSHSLSRV